MNPKQLEPTRYRETDVEPLQDEVVYNGFSKVTVYHMRHKRYDGAWSEPLKRELIGSSDAVIVLPYDPVLDCVVLVEQFRVSAYARGVKPWLVECIAGRIDGNETPEQVAVREAKEEAGCSLNDLIKIGRMFMSPGLFAEYATMFCARTDAGNISGFHGLETEHEDIRVLTPPFDDAMAALDDGRISSAPAFICLNWLARHREKLQKCWASLI